MHTQSDFFWYRMFGTKSQPQIMVEPCPPASRSMADGVAATSWCYVPTDSQWRESVGTIEAAISGVYRYLQHLPRSLEILIFDKLNRTLEKVSLPSSFQSLTFGRNFNQSLTGVILPSSIQSLTFGDCINQTLDGVSLPSGLQSLHLGIGSTEPWRK